MSRPDAIVGYTYKAENLCPSCTIDAVVGSKQDGMSGRAVEIALDRIAPLAGVLDRYNEHSFDSDEFPKVIFADSVIEGERCGNCDNKLEAS